FRHAAGNVARGAIDAQHLEVIAGAVDEITVLVELEVAAAREQIDAGEDRRAVRKRRRLLHDEIARPVDCHEGVDGGVLDVAMAIVGAARTREHAAGELQLRRRVRHQIGEARVDALEARGLRIGDIARDVFQRESLRAQAADRGRHGTEKTHYTLHPSAVPARTRARPPPETWQALCQESNQYISTA